MAQAVKTFLRRYRDVSACQFSNARLSFVLHHFGWVFRVTISHSQGGHMRRGRRIPVNAQLAGHSCKGSKGKAKVPSGRPASHYLMPIRKNPPGKKAHSLNASIVKGTQNGGKW